MVDLEEGKVGFVHTGASTSRLALRVSDGQKVCHNITTRTEGGLLKLELHIHPYIMCCSKQIISIGFLTD